MTIVTIKRYNPELVLDEYKEVVVKMNQDEDGAYVTYDDFVHAMDLKNQQLVRLREQMMSLTTQL